jgi:hypothetical protein
LKTEILAAIIALLVVGVLGVSYFAASGSPSSTSGSSTVSIGITNSIASNSQTIISTSICGSTATSMVSAPGSSGSLWVSANLSPQPGTKACVDSIFLNTGKAPIDLSLLTLTVNVTDSSGTSIYEDGCNVMYSPSILTTGHIWECTFYWNAGVGPYELHVGIHSINSTEPLAAVDAPVDGSQVCISNIDSTVQPQYVSTLHQMITIPSFIQYSNGRCWTWDSTFVLSGPRGSNDTFVFTHFSDEIWYLCGTPAFKADGIIHVVPSYSSDGRVTGVWITSQNNIGTSCPG